VIERRAPSLLIQHREWRFHIPGDLTPLSKCPGQLAIYVTPSAVRGFEAMLVVKCLGCGKPLEARGVIPEGVTYWQDDAWDSDPDDCTDAPWGV
jgi:hypothetical protein